MLYEDVIEVDERVVLCRPDVSGETGEEIVGTTGEMVRVWRPLNEEKLRADLSKMYVYKCVWSLGGGVGEKKTWEVELWEGDEEVFVSPLLFFLVNVCFFIV